MDLRHIKGKIEYLLKFPDSPVKKHCLEKNVF